MKERKGIVILLCRNALNYSRKCVQTLIGQTYPCEILVVDNASTDGTARYMAALQVRTPGMYRMTFSEVAGVARCWNESLNWAWLRGHSEALVVNSDTELLPKTYEVLREAMASQEHCGVMTGVGVPHRPRLPEGELQHMAHPHYSCYMIAEWCHRRIPFDERYDGAYLEDCKHHISMFRAGIYAGSVNLEFFHHFSGTMKTADQPELDRIGRHYLANKARFYQEFGAVPGTKGYEALFGGKYVGP